MTAAAARKPRAAHAPPRVIGHRGAAGLAPENTPASFRKAAALGARWVEFDVHLSKDSVPVILHDDTVERTSDGRGAVAALDLAELKRLDAGRWFAPEFAGERIPTLVETFALLETLDLGAAIEIKPSPGAAEATATAVLELVLARWPEQLPPPMVSSFDRAALARARDVAPGVMRALLVREVPTDWRAEMDRLGCTALHASHRTLGAAAVRAVAQTGIPLFAYTVNEPARAAELFAWGVASVFSDRPDLVAAAAGGGPV